MSEPDVEFMRQAILLSENNLLTKNGGPFGAVIVKNGTVITGTANSVTKDNDPTAHAEVNAIRQACRILQTADLEGCVMYTSCEPCPMCLSAIYWARISHVYYANTRHDAEQAGFGDTFIYSELNKPLAERSVSFKRIIADEAITAFKKWAAMPAAMKDDVKNGSL